MTSHREPGWRRLATKTHGTFETIPSLRVPGKDRHSGHTSSHKASAKKPAQYADPTLFPGRRLDRRQQSNYSGVSGNSGLSGIDQLTLHSAGRFRTAGSNAGSTKLSQSSLPSVGVTRGAFLQEGCDPWGSARQLREDSPLTLLKRQMASGESEVKAGPASLIPHQSSFSKVSRWQHANFPLPSAQRNRPVSLETRDKLLESPDSLESHESELQPPVDYDLIHQQQLRREEQKERELRQQEMMQRHTRGRYTPPPLKVDSTLPTQQQRRGARHVNPHRRPAHTPAVSPTPSGHGPKLNKILWALVPDEHANNSDAGISHMQPSCQETSATGDNAGHFVTVTDLDAGSTDTRHVPDTRYVPDTPRNPRLTEQILSGHNQSSSWSRDDRIVQWLAECDQETTSQSLPTHLPDIQYTFKYLKSAT